MSTELTIEQVQEACKTSLHFLCTQMLGFQDWDTIHDDIEKALNRPSRKKLMLIPRGHLKTAVITKGYSIQQMLRNPDVRILISNQVWDRARDMLYEIKEWLTTKSDLPKIFGDFISDRWREDDIVVRQRKKALAAPTIGTSGVEAELTSAHYDIIILDDLQGEKNFQTSDQREKVKRYYRSMMDLLEPGGLLIVVGTRWHLDDVYSYILENEAEYFDVMVRKVVEDGRIIFPKKFNKRFNAQLKCWESTRQPTMDFIDYLKKRPSEEFYSQYMNDPTDEKNQIIKKEYFKYYDRRPERLFVSMTIDPAISEKQSADYFAINVSGMDDNYNIFVLDTLKGHWKLSESVDNIFLMYQKWNPSVIGLETVAFQKALKSWLEETMRNRGVFFPITELKRNTNETKEFRIKALEPFYREGKIFHAPWMKSLEEEAMSFPKGKHDDELDALASQLDLLMPGDATDLAGMPIGCWEEALQEAQRFSRGKNDFFHEVPMGTIMPEKKPGKSFWDNLNG